MRRHLFLFGLTAFLLFGGTEAFSAPAKKASPVQKTTSAKKAAPAQKKTADRPQQVVLTSDGGLEWNSVKKTLTAEDRALVVRGDTALGADKIVAHYRESAAGKDGDVYLVKAFGNIIITTPKQVVYGDNAVYEIENSVIILKGNPVKLVAGQEQMTARVLELWQNKDMAVARQDVTATKDARRLEADTVKAFFVKKGNGTQVERFEAEDNVTITNDKETVQGDTGVYFVDRETATLQGNVKISQGNNVIVGDVADINMKTGVSRLQMLSEKGKTKKQVRGVFVPEDRKKDKTNAAKPKKPAALKEQNGAGGNGKATEKLLSSSDEGE